MISNYFIKQSFKFKLFYIMVTNINIIYMNVSVNSISENIQKLESICFIKKPRSKPITAFSITPKSCNIKKHRAYLIRNSYVSLVCNFLSQKHQTYASSMFIDTYSIIEPRHCCSPGTNLKPIVVLCILKNVSSRNLSSKHHYLYQRHGAH